MERARQAENGALFLFASRVRLRTAFIIRTSLSGKLEAIDTFTGGNWALTVIRLRKVLSSIAGLGVAAAVFATPASAHRVVSLDGCADQYVLGLVPRSDIAAVSMRARLADSYYRDRAEGVKQVRPTIESVLALSPDIVVRTWGGDARLMQMLEKHGVKVITVNDINNLDKAKDELLRVGHALDSDAVAAAEVTRFDAAMNDIRPIGIGRSVLYYTPSGFSAGPDTLVGDMLTRLDFRLETQDKGFFFLSPEILLSLKPDVFALAFYDDRYAMRRVPGRNPVIRKLIITTPHFTLPARALACSGWFIAYDLRALSRTTVK